MRTNSIQLLAVFATLVWCKTTFAEFMILTLSTDKISYQVGETVNWAVQFDIGGSTANNFGLATITINLADSQGNVLSPGVVNSSFPPNGLGLYTRFGGAWDPTTLRLLELGAALPQNNLAVVGSNASQRNNLPLAIGSYVVTTIGNHMLIGSPGTANNFFTTSDGLNSSNLPSYSPITFNNASFNVTAVPEPSSFLLLFLTGLGFAVVRRKYASLTSNTTLAIENRVTECRSVG
jgi:hypothetical protein